MSDSQPTPDPARSYGSVAEAYHRGRPGYPAEAVRWMLGTEPRIVLELGAGTGKLTDVMVAEGHAVHAVEPDMEMLAILEREVPGASAKQAVAEEIPANDNSVDVVVVGQAFHWFDHARALPEIARILKPEGEIALVWNSPDLRIPWVRRLCDLIGHQDQDTSSVDELVNSGLFGFVEDTTFKAWQDVNRESIIDLALSRSSIASLDADHRAEKLAQVADFYSEYGRGHYGMQVPYTVRCFRARVLDPVADSGTFEVVVGPQTDVGGDEPRADEGPGDDMLLIDFK